MKVITHQWHGQHNPVAAVHWALLPDQGDDELDDEHPGKGAVEPGELDEIGNVPAWWCVEGSADLYIDKIFWSDKFLSTYIGTFWNIDKDVNGRNFYYLGKKHRATNSEVAIVKAVKAARPQLK